MCSACNLPRCPPIIWTTPASLFRYRKPHVLIMDEPTNHLDMESKATLEEALVDYEGSLITVSHDRWFLDQVVNRIWELQDGVVTVYYGNYTDYVRAKKGLPPLAEGEVSEV